MYLNNITSKKPKQILKELVIFFYIYMILEGILRKWLIPTLNKEIYFLKDFFLICIYSYAFKHKFLFDKKISKIFTIIIIFILFFGAIGYNFNKIEVLSFIAGSRSYFLFVPLFFIIIHTFSIEDIKKFVKINLYFILPYYILVLFQTYSPYDDYINSGYKSLVQNPERPSAYFTYITQNTYYFLFLITSYYSYLNCQSSLGKKKLFLSGVLIFLLMGIMILLKSRAVYVYTFAIIFYSTYINLVSNENKSLKFKKLIIILVFTPIFFIVNTSLFEKQYKFSAERINKDDYKSLSLFKEYSENEIKNNFIIKILEKFDDTDNTYSSVRDFCSKNSSICRVINEIYFVPTLKYSSLFGEGIGAGTSMVAHLRDNQQFHLGEAENHRVIGELGYLFGTILVLLKYLFFIFLNLKFFFSKKITNKLFLFPFLIFVTVTFLIGPITYTTSFISFICWFALGILFASTNENKNIS
mgnify:FL=1